MSPREIRLLQFGNPVTERCVTCWLVNWDMGEPLILDSLPGFSCRAAKGAEYAEKVSGNSDFSTPNASCCDRKFIRMVKVCLALEFPYFSSFQVTAEYREPTESPSQETSDFLCIP